MNEVTTHHDNTLLNSRDFNLMRSYGKWIDTVRSLNKLPTYPDTNEYRDYQSDWVPSDIDMVKSRLFWWIRQGNEPLPYPPPTAFSCPWYELITQPGGHDCMELSIWEEEGKKYVAANQCRYRLIEQTDDENLIVGFGPYRFKAFRDEEQMAKEIALTNRRPDQWVEYLGIVKDKQRAWFLERQKDLEVKG